MVELLFDASPLAIAYTIQRKGVKSFNVSQKMWHDLFKNSESSSAKEFCARFKVKLRERCRGGETLKKLEFSIPTLETFHGIPTKTRIAPAAENL